MGHPYRICSKFLFELLVGTEKIGVKLTGRIKRIIYANRSLNHTQSQFKTAVTTLRFYKYCSRISNYAAPTTP